MIQDYPLSFRPTRQTVFVSSAAHIEMFHSFILLHLRVAASKQRQKQQERQTMGCKGVAEVA